LRTLRLLAALVCGVAACGGGDEAVAPTTTVTTPTTTSTTLPPTTAPPTPTTAPPAPTWVLGATPLPTRPDGFGEIQPTPEALVDRQLTAPDVLPPPASGGFESTIDPIDDAVRARMGGSWQEGCPVAIEDLRYLTLSFVGFDGAAHTGELIVNASVADDVVSVFHELFDAGFPIEEMRIVTDADIEAPPTGDGNDTAGFNCRLVRGGRTFSAHAYGLAIDVNPFQNPYTNDDVVLPERASAYVERADVRPGMIVEDGPVVAAFDAVGWTWGGRWRDPVDRMHFSANGR
jgi:hypothetical protein